MRRWVSQVLDAAAFAWFRRIARDGVVRAYSPAVPCDLACLDQVTAPDAAGLRPERPWRGWTTAGFHFPSPLASPEVEGQMVRGLLVSVGDDRPWVLLVPGFGVGTLPPRKFGIFLGIQAVALLGQGLNVALMETPMHMSRRLPGSRSGAGIYTPDLARMQRLFLQGAGDVTAIVHFLSSRYRRPVGIWATSLGACFSALAVTRCATPAAIVLMEPLDHPLGPLLGRSRHWQEFQHTLGLTGTDGLGSVLPNAGALLDSLRSIAPSSHAPAVPRERMLFVTPAWDQVVPAVQQEQFWQAWGRPERWTPAAGHITAAGSRRLARAVASWLARRLLAPPSAQDLTGQPTAAAAVSAAGIQSATETTPSR